MTIKLRFRYWYDEIEDETHLLVLDRDTEEIIGHYERSGKCTPRDFTFEIGSN